MRAFEKHIKLLETKMAAFMGHQRFKDQSIGVYRYFPFNKVHSVNFAHMKLEVTINLGPGVDEILLTAECPMMYEQNLGVWERYLKSQLPAAK